MPINGWHKGIGALWDSQTSCNSRREWLSGSFQPDSPIPTGYRIWGVYSACQGRSRYVVGKLRFCGNRIERLRYTSVQGEKCKFTGYCSSTHLCCTTLEHHVRCKWLFFKAIIAGFRGAGHGSEDTGGICCTGADLTISAVTRSWA